MKCEQVQSLLSVYLDGEVTPSEQVLIQAHLSSCTDCQQELTLLSTARDRVRSTLQRRAAHAAPARDAWDRLEKSLTEADQLSSGSEARSSRLAPNAGRASIFKKFGGVPMRKKIFASALGVLAVISMVAVFLARNVTSVSAQQILERASQAQSQPAPTQGIQHIRSENYYSLDGSVEKGVQTLLDSYGDLQTGNYRTVVTDVRTGKVMDASAFDGANTYTPDHSVENTGDNPLTVYRTPQGQVELKPGAQQPTAPNDKAMFDQMRGDPNVKFTGKETWADGRTVYILQSHQLVKMVIGGQASQPDGMVTMYFDVTTYQQLGFRMTTEKDGQEILLASRKTLADEILPVGTKVAWDLSDVKGITIVDDPNREHGDLLPQIIAPQDLVARTKTAYLLKTVPEGYSLEISEPQRKPGSSEPYMYIASYRDTTNDYFVIQSGFIYLENAYNNVDETYTTASGLVLHFQKDESDPSGKPYISADVEAPGGVTFMINSTLPRETVKVWAEQLVLIK